MDFFEQNKALIITVLLLSVMLLAMYNIHLSNSNRQLTETLVELESYEDEKGPEEQETPRPEEQEQSPQQSSRETHQAFNQEREESEKKFDSRLEEIFKKNSAEQTAADEENSETQGDFEVNKDKSEEARKRSDGENTSTETSARTGNIKNSSISFSLLGRRAIDIPNPVYTCDRSGKIVVNISVDQKGKVIRTAINKASSTSTNECLTERALEYAAEALFSELPGRTSQIGTITYKFQG